MDKGSWGLQSMRLQRIGQDSVTDVCFFIFLILSKCYYFVDIPIICLPNILF